MTMIQRYYYFLNYIKVKLIKLAQEIIWQIDKVFNSCELSEEK